MHRGAARSAAWVFNMEGIMEMQIHKKLKIQAIVFDMDGLLFDSEKIVQRTWTMAGERLGYGPIGDHIYHTLGMNRKGRAQYFQKVYGMDFPMETFSEMTRAYFQDIAATEGVPLKTGVMAMLEYAKAHDYKMAVATSSSRAYAAGLMEKAGIYTYFDSAIFGDMVQNSKPDPEIYQRSCENLGIPPQNCIALEDAPNGLRSACNAGLHPIMIPDLVEPDDSIQKLVLAVCKDMYAVIRLLENFQ